MVSQRYLVTGATGAIGPSVVHALCRAGHEVTVLCRTKPEQGLLPDGVRVLRGDIVDHQAVDEATHGQHVIIHLASLLHVNEPSPAQEAEIERINVGGTRNLLIAAKRNFVERVVFISSISVYGHAAQRGVLDEYTEPQPDTIYGRTKLAAETIALNTYNHQGQPLTCVLRLSAVYGPHMKGNYRTLLRALARGRFVPIGLGHNRRTMVHSDDVVHAIIRAASSDGAGGEVFNVTDGSFHEMREIIAAMCCALDRSPPVLMVPPWLARSGAKLLDFAFRAIGSSTSVSGAVEKYLEEVSVRGDKISRIGFVPQLDLDTGWKRTVSEIRDLGRL